MKSIIAALICLTSICFASAEDDTILGYLRDIALPLKTADDLSPIIEAIGDRNYVLLGEASHGTSEYYTWRAAISKRLITEKGFRYIAVEGDWSAAYEVNKFVKDLPGAGASAGEVLASFDRWPEWMWNNEEVKHLIKWLREYNLTLPVEERVGFYGMDLYSPWDSIHEVIAFIENYHPDKSSSIRNAYRCILRFENNPQRYAASVYQGRVNCEDDVLDAVNILRTSIEGGENTGDSALFNAVQNALVVKNAELHYRSMAEEGPASWNSRVRHFKQTVERLSEFYNGTGRGIVWAHNTHVGDASATPMALQGLENIGYLLRKKHGEENVYIVGFSTYRGTVLAGREWGGEMEYMNIPEAINGSHDDLLQRVGEQSALFVFDETMPASLLNQRGHRAKGVTYQPERELGNYVPTILPRRYDAVIFIEETSALNPLF